MQKYILQSFCILFMALANSVQAVADEDVDKGKEIFEKRCYYCHGLKGGGDGPVVPRLDPKPRNFRNADFRFRTTPLGTLPTEDNLFKTVSDGVFGTAMPFWKTLLSEQERRQVIGYIKTFSDKWEKEGPGKPITVPEEPPFDEESIAKGEELFKKNKCFLCHGDEGRGDGRITKTLRNEWGFQFRARDLTKGWLFKGGNTTQDIFNRISTGLNGTPMGSFAELITEEDRWHLVHFVKSLNRDPIPVTKGGGSIVVESKMIEEGDLATDPFDSRWDEIKKITEIEMGGQLMVAPRSWTRSINAVNLRSMFNEDSVAFLVEWDDRTGAQDEIYRDAISIQFPVKEYPGAEKPHFAMGDRTHKVNIWKWKAEYNPEAQAEGFQNIREYDGGISVKEINGKGFKKPLVTQATTDISGKGYWKDGRWRVVFTRSLITEDKANDVQFAMSKNIPVAFAAWNGANNEIGSVHSLAPWYYVVLKTPTPVSIYIYAIMGLIIAAGGELWFVGWLRNKRSDNK
ncbi:MAG: ethylbenzene dehydrogenase-related protein [Candidatus Scalinduaceae bacterium]